jgi:hypothetical protein
MLTLYSPEPWKPDNHWKSIHHNSIAQIAKSQIISVNDSNVLSYGTNPV